MGEFADDIIDAFFDSWWDEDDEEDWFESRPFRSVGAGKAPPPGYWRTREGSLIAIESMTNSHLANTLRLIETWDPPPYARWAPRAEIVRRSKALREVMKEATRHDPSA